MIYRSRAAGGKESVRERPVILAENGPIQPVLVILQLFINAHKTTVIAQRTAIQGPPRGQKIQCIVIAYARRAQRATDRIADADSMQGA